MDTTIFTIHWVCLIEEGNVTYTYIHLLLRIYHESKPLIKRRFNGESFRDGFGEASFGEGGFGEGMFKLLKKLSISR